jgi:hypothetical protein
MARSADARSRRRVGCFAAIDGEVRLAVPALSDRRSPLKNEYSPAVRISPLAAAQNAAFGIRVLLYSFNPATAG